MKVKAVILAGGSGTRLWPLSRMQLPKQFLKLQGDKTLLDATVHRLSPLIDQSDVIVVTGAEHATGEAYNSLKPYQTILEPEGRNTAPAIALAAQCLALQASADEDPIMVVLPADHIIKDQKAFQQALQQAIEGAAEGNLVTFGIKPARADTGFGYIQAQGLRGKVQGTSNQKKEDSSRSPSTLNLSPSTSNLLPVERFTEKPDQKTAERLLQSGDYFWNSGMFVWRTSVILKEIKQHLPEVYQLIEALKPQLQAAPCKLQAEAWRKMPSISIDYGVLEKSDRVKLVPCEIGWSDVGSWDAVHEISEQDEAHNVLQGRVIAKSCNNTLIHSNHRLVAAVGVEDLCVVETPDAVLVTQRGETQRVREIVEHLKHDKDAQEHLFHCTVNRPWGSYTVLEEHTGFKMKRITVLPEAHLSLQRHQHRSEHWIVVSGTATVTRDGTIETITKNQSTYIPIGMTHRLENRGKIPLEIIEVQVGEYLEEDDIERFEDTYGRDEQ